MTKSPFPLSEEPSQSVWPTAHLVKGSSSHEKTAIEIASLQRGHECLVQGKIQDAEECYRRVLQLNPASVEGCQALAEVFNLQGRLEESATCYRRAIELLSSSSVEAGNSTSQISTPFNSFPVVEVEQLQTLLEQAEAALAAKQWNIVKDRCEQLLQLQPSAKTYKLLGNALQAKGEIEAAVQAYTQALQIQPGWAEVYANLGSLKAQQQQWQAAIDDYQKAIHLKPDFAGAYRNLARIWAQINRPDQARQCWYQAFTLEPQKATPEAHFDLGNQLLEQGDRSAAIACYRHAIEQDPNFAAAYQNLAIALNQPESSSVPAIGRSGLTVTRSDQTIVPLSLQARPQSAEQWVDLGTTYAEQQQWEKARSCYQQALQLDPNQAAAHWNLSEVWQEMQNPIAAAESMYQALSLEPTWANSEEHLALGHRLLSFDRVDLAAACYLRVTQLAPNHADAFYGLGEILARKEQLSDAVAHYRRAIDLDPNQLAYYRSLGQVLIQLKDWPQVQDCYRQLIRLEPTNPQNYVALAEAATQQGQFETALQTYRQLVEAQPTFWEAHHKIGDLLTQQQQWDAAVEAFQRSIDLNPQFSWSYNNLGDALLHLERWQEAAEAFERAISLKSDFHWSHYNLGETCTHLERWDTAVAAYRNALALNPDLPRLQQKLGFALRHQGEAILIEALSCYRRAIEQDPDDVQNYHGAIDLQPDDEDLYNGLVNTFLKQGDAISATVFQGIAQQIQERNEVGLKEFSQLTEQQKRLEIIEHQESHSSFEGHLEKISEQGIRGWARSKDVPDAALTIEILDNGKVIEHCLAHEFRLDLQSAGKGTGRHGFKIPLSFSLRDGKEHSITARIKDTQYFLNKTPIRFIYNLHRPYQNFEEYLRWAMIYREFSAPFLENDKRIIGYMDGYKNRLGKAYSKLNQDELISIIMPAYNRESVIASSIDSILNQTYQNWELIVIDDGSIDETCNVVSQFTDSRIKLLKLAENSGVSKARNYGLARARGKYIAYLDTDNTMEQDFLLLTLNTLKNHPEAESVYCAQKVITAQQPRAVEEDVYAIRFGPFNRSLLENRNYIDLNAFVHTKGLYEKLGGFNEEMRRLVDWDLLLRYTQDNPPISLPCILSNYYHGLAVNQITKTESFEDANDYITARLKSNSFNLDNNGRKISYAFSYRMLPKKMLGGKNFASIIIPSYEVPDYLKYCVRSVQKFTTPGTYEIIIVDNNSSSDTIQLLKQLEREGIKVIYNSKNMGFTYAANQGIEIARSDSHIVLLNNDALVTPGWLEAMTVVLGEEANVGIVVPQQVLLPQTKTMDTHVPYCNPKREVDVSLSAHHQNILVPEVNWLKEYTELSFAPFFCVLINRDCLRKVGLLDAKNGRHYRSDRLYCDAVRNFAKMRIIYTPHSKLYHFLQQATSHLKVEDPQQYQTMFTRNSWEDKSEARLVFQQVERSML